MENLQNRVDKLTRISEYRFKSDVIKNILSEFKKEFKKSNFDKAVALDKKKHPVFIDFEKMIKIIDDKLQNNKFNVKFTPENIIDGYGNIAIAFNGNPYITMNLALMALRTHNNVVFFSKKYYAVNSIIVQTLNKACKKLKYADEIGLVEFSEIDEIIRKSRII